MSRHRSAHPAIQLFPFLAVLVSVMGALIFLLLVTSKRIPQVAVARARAAQSKVQTTPADHAGPALSIPELTPMPAVPADAEWPTMPMADLDSEGLSPAELQAQERDAERNAERVSLIDQWRRRIESLQTDRDQQESQVQQQTLLTSAAERRQLAMLAELQDLERKLGSLTGKVSVGSMQTGNADKERIQLEQRILGLRRQTKALADQQRADAGKYSIVPFDGKSGTTRRPILVECTSTGFRFVPEDVFISAADIEGFTERQNPLLAGAVVLTQYWNQVNQEQGGTTPDTQPYVLLIVRPSGTLGYYVSVRLLAALKQQHGYELVGDDVDLKWPAVDVGAQAACRAAVEGMLAHREELATAGNGSGGGGIAGGRIGNGGPGGERIIGGGSGSHPGGVSGGGSRGGGSGVPGKAPLTGGRSGFQLSDLDAPSEGVGNRSWEDPSKFGGLEHRRDKTKGTGGPRTATGDGVPSRGGAPNNGGSGNADSMGTPGNAASQVQATGNIAATDETRPEAARGGAKSPTNTSPGQPNWTARPVSNSAPRTAQNQSLEEEHTDPSTDDAAPTASSRSSAPLPPNGPRSGSRPRNSGLPPNGDPRLARGPKRGNGQDIPYELLQHRRWGQFEEGANIGLEKPVAIFVDAEQIIVADQLIIPIRPGATRTEMFDQLLAAIDENAASWGPAATGFFWVPSLRFVISPGGNQIYDRLAPLVTRSGLRADAEFTLDRPQSSAKGGRP